MFDKGAIVKPSYIENPPKSPLIEKKPEIDLLDEVANLFSGEICVTDIQHLRGLVVGEYLQDKNDGHIFKDYDHGGIHQYRRILGYFNYLEDKLLKGEKE